jgi:hypothetical protein
MIYLMRMVSAQRSCALRDVSLLRRPDLLSPVHKLQGVLPSQSLEALYQARQLWKPSPRLSIRSAH